MNVDSRPEAVGAFIVPRNSPIAVFLGVRHTGAKEASERIASQLSIFTETKEPGETDAQTLARLFMEEAHVDGLSGKQEINGLRLATCTIRTRKAEADLHSYLIEVDKIDLQTQIKINDGELSEIGWAMFQTVLDAPKGSWWIRAGVYETIKAYNRWLSEQDKFKPSMHTSPIHRVPTEVFVLMEKGFSETEALSQLGLHLPHAVRHWGFVHSQ